MRFGLDYAAFKGNIRAAVSIVESSNRRLSTSTSSYIAVLRGHQAYIDEGKRRGWDCMGWGKWDSEARQGANEVWDRWMVDYRDERVQSDDDLEQIEKQRRLARDPNYVY